MHLTYTEESQLSFVRVFMVTEIKSRDPSSSPNCPGSSSTVESSYNRLIQINCKQFIPRRIGSENDFQFENMLLTKQRMENWIHRNGKIFNYFIDAIKLILIINSTSIDRNQTTGR